MAGSSTPNGGQMIVDYLIQERVPYAFGLCGHGNIGFIDALHERADEITTISVHHETVAGFMADVYYRVGGKPTATFTSCGPGSANLPIALANSYFDSVPFLAITGNVPTSQFNRGAFQETYRQHQADFPSTVRAYCKRVFQPTRGEMMPVAVRQAWKTMITGRPGPVVLDVPFDIFKEPVGEPTPDAQAWNANISSRCGADPQGVEKTLDLLLAAERPVILVGQGVKYGAACDALRQLAERLRIPVAQSASGIGAMPADHPLSLGLVARNGTYQANHAARQADVLLALGVPLRRPVSSSWLPGYSFSIPDAPDPRRHRSRRGRPSYPVSWASWPTSAPSSNNSGKGSTDAASLIGLRHGRPPGSTRSPVIDANGRPSSRPASPTPPSPIHPQRAPPSRSTAPCPRTRSWSATSASITTG
ncbi:MAG: thiamine pyrophosphate-binding protein [Burkholderiaceae bacterium]